MCASTERSLEAPPLFGRERRLLGWQGITLSHPGSWFLRTFGGNHNKGSLRLFDDEGLRIEVLWETPRAGADVPGSIGKFMDGLEREAKKAKRAFKAANSPDLLSRKKPEREQATTFGWSGYSSDPLATQGWGASWECSTCKRVVVAHLIGRSHEGTRDTQKMASEILASMSCHGVGGWETWSVFGLRLEIPEDFDLKNARLLAGRIECDWERVGPQLPLTPGWTRMDERISIVRVSAASVVLQNEELPDYIARTLTNPDKKRVWKSGVPSQFAAREGTLFAGQPREMRKRALFNVQKRYVRRKPPLTELRAWHEEPSNKIFALMTELRPNNVHVAEDILESIEQTIETSST